VLPGDARVFVYRLASTSVQIDTRDVGAMPNAPPTDPDFGSRFVESR
jgi:hypothetical protein